MRWLDLVHSHDDDGDMRARIACGKGQGVLTMRARIAYGKGQGVLGMPDWVGWWVRAVQELRRLGRAGSAWLEAIRQDQVCGGGTALRSARWALTVGRGGCSAQIVIVLKLRISTPLFPVLML